MDAKRRSFIVSFLITVIILFSIYFTCFYKESITTATYNELTEICGIGHETAQDIIYYCDENKNATVEDLEHINGIGCNTIELLRERWK